MGVHAASEHFVQQLFQLNCRESAHSFIHCTNLNLQVIEILKTNIDQCVVLSVEP